MNYGMKVNMKFVSMSPFAGKSQVLRNVTEIHYNYPNHIDHPMIAFESDIHGTGITYRIDQIEEFETELETKKARGF